MEVRPRELECDVVRFQNNKEKWVALVGLLTVIHTKSSRVYRMRTRVSCLPKSVSKGKIVKTILDGGLKRDHFQFVNKRGYKITVEGLSEKFDPNMELCQADFRVLRYRMPIEHVIKLVYQLQLTSDNINTWKKGVVTALKISEGW